MPKSRKLLSYNFRSDIIVSAWSFYKCPYGSWGSIEDTYTMLFNHLPKPTCIWKRWNTFKYNLSVSSCQRPICNIRMTCNPTNICGTPKNIIRFNQMYRTSLILHAEDNLQSNVESFRPSSGTRCIQYK